MSSTAVKICGDRQCERLTAEECAFRGAYIWLCVKQAYGCHRSDGELSHNLYDIAMTADELNLIGFYFAQKRERIQWHERKV